MKYLVLGIVVLLFLAACAEANLVGDAKGGKPGKDIKPECSDGKDNDLDGRCDYQGCEAGKGRNKQFLPADPDCSSASDNTEEYECIPIPEVCDGNDNDCDGLVDENACASCGNGVTENGEQCDFGMSNGACPATCSNDCHINYCEPSAVCGNGIVEGTEECDDGNIVGGDGCTTYCFDESTFYCIDGDGDNPYTVSNTTSYNSTFQIYTDYCWSNTTLTENICNGNWAQITYHDCSEIGSYCLNGRCV